MGVPGVAKGGFGLCSAKRAMIAACVALCACLAIPSAAGAYPAPGNPFQFNPDIAQQTGPEVMVFDKSAQGCEPDDIPDTPARAFKDSSNNIQLLSTHFFNYRNISTTTLDGTYTHPCTRIMTPTNSSTHSSFDNKEWLGSPWTPDGTKVYALVHNEYQGQTFQSGCGDYQYQCWWNSITSATSTDAGASYTNTSPGHLVATPPFQFSKDGPEGYFTPSNIVKTGDGWFYAMFRSNEKLPQQLGTCLMRTRDLSDPTSWRAWNGSSFSVRFANPYLESINPADHVCAPVDFLSIGTITESLTYNTYLKKWMLVGNSVGDPAFGKPPGVYYALSDDLLNWTHVELLFAAEITWVRDCVPPDPIKEASILDPSSTSRNFTTVDQTAQIFYTWYHMSGCNGTLDRDIVRIPIQFNTPAP
jgi:hypothetical protein